MVGGKPQTQTGCGVDLDPDVVAGSGCPGRAAARPRGCRAGRRNSSRHAVITPSRPGLTRRRPPSRTLPMPSNWCWWRCTAEIAAYMVVRAQRCQTSAVVRKADEPGLSGEPSTWTKPGTEAPPIDTVADRTGAITRLRLWLPSASWKLSVANSRRSSTPPISIWMSAALALSPSARFIETWTRSRSTAGSCQGSPWTSRNERTKYRSSQAARSTSSDTTRTIPSNQSTTAVPAPRMDQSTIQIDAYAVTLPCSSNNRRPGLAPARMIRRLPDDDLGMGGRFREGAKSLDCLNLRLRHKLNAQNLDRDMRLRRVSRTPAAAL